MNSTDLEESERPRPHVIDGDGKGFEPGTVVLDASGDAWQVNKDGYWDLIGGAYRLSPTLDPTWGPYKLIYTPKEES